MISVNDKTETDRQTDRDGETESSTETDNEALHVYYSPPTQSGRFVGVTENQ